MGGLWSTAVIPAPNPRHSGESPTSFPRQTHVIPAKAGIQRGGGEGNGVLCFSLDTRVRGYDGHAPTSFPRQTPRHSRGRGNPEGRRGVMAWLTFLWLPACAGMT